MHRRDWVLAGVTVALFLWLRAASGGRIPCMDVISEVNRDIGMGRSPDASRIAKTLKTSPVWVEHCMVTYGRRLRRAKRDENEAEREEQLEKFEEEEPEEIAPEEKGEEEPREQPAPKKQRRSALRKLRTPE
jgi:hypothetical protein